MKHRYIEKVQYTKGLEKTSYLYNLPVVQYLLSGHKIAFNKDVTFFVGENGSGKSTLIEAIAICFGLNAEGGSKNFNFSTRNTSSELFKHIKIIKVAFPKDGYFLRAESFYNVASNIDDIQVTGYGDCSLHEQSHGESFFSLFQNRFRGNDLYVLDEPEVALSPARQMSLLVKIKELVKHYSQFIIATHSPILLSYPDATIFELTGSKIKEVPFEDCGPYKIYKRFLNDPNKMLRYLFDD
ncbi:MAG: AAA family ATPase [Endomicrobium sp.]|jgi:predicted ATPase|nr:AAA family ATPase [Endomicrobium sp.]